MRVDSFLLIICIFCFSKSSSDSCSCINWLSAALLALQIPQYIIPTANPLIRRGKTVGVFVVSIESFTKILLKRNYIGMDMQFMN